MNEETKFKRKVLKFLKELPGDKWIYKTSEKFITGIPDILFLYVGCLFALELKIKNNPATTIQIYTLSTISEAGGKSYILHPNNFKEFQDVVHKLYQESKTNIGVVVETFTS